MKSLLHKLFLFLLINLMLSLFYNVGYEQVLLLSSGKLRMDFCIDSIECLVFTLARLNGFFFFTDQEVSVCLPGPIR